MVFARMLSANLPAVTEYGSDQMLKDCLSRVEGRSSRCRGMCGVDLQGAEACGYRRF